MKQIWYKPHFLLSSLFIIFIRSITLNILDVGWNCSERKSRFEGRKKSSIAVLALVLDRSSRTVIQKVNDTVDI